MVILDRFDHPLNVKRGGVCVYYKEHLPLRVRNELSFLPECLICEVKVNKKKCILTGLYRSLSQTVEQFPEFKKLF